MSNLGGNRSGRLIWSLMLAWLAGWPLAAPGKTINVPADYSQVQGAIDAAKDGDEIIVAPGVYHGTVRFNGKDITLRSLFDPDKVRTPNQNYWWYVTQTFLTGDYKGSVVVFSGGESAKCVLRGFTICYGNGGGGGAISDTGSKATIEYNYIMRNNNVFGVFGAMNAGGAIEGCDGLIQKNIFQFNHSNYGGALANCGGTIQNNVFYQNATHAGSSKPTLGSAAGKPLGYVLPGGGGALYNCSGTIRNNIILDNYSQDANGWGAGGLDSCKGTIVNNIIYHTTMTATLEYNNCSKPSYCLFRASRSGTRNITGDPLFANLHSGDFHLQAGSPAIDAGKGLSDLKEDYDGHQRGLKAVSASRGDGSATDIGAFEALPTPVAVWLPHGGPAGGIKDGQPLNVSWQLAASAGTSIRLWLRKGQMFVADLGPWSPVWGMDYTTVMLPKLLASGSDYTILGISVSDHTLGFSCPAFTIAGSRKNGVRGGDWSGYE